MSWFSRSFIYRLYAKNVHCVGMLWRTRVRIGRGDGLGRIHHMGAVGDHSADQEAKVFSARRLPRSPSLRRSSSFTDLDTASRNDQIERNLSAV